MKLGTRVQEPTRLPLGLQGESDSGGESTDMFACTLLSRGGLANQRKNAPSAQSPQTAPPYLVSLTARDMSAANNRPKSGPLPGVFRLTTREKEASSPEGLHDTFTLGYARGAVSASDGWFQTRVQFAPGRERVALAQVAGGDATMGTSGSGELLSKRWGQIEREGWSWASQLDLAKRIISDYLSA